MVDDHQATHPSSILTDQPRPHARGGPPSTTSAVYCETTSTSSKQQKKKRGKEGGCAVEVCGAGMCMASTRGLQSNVRDTTPKGVWSSGDPCSRRAIGRQGNREKSSQKRKRKNAGEKNKKGHKGSCCCSPTRLASLSQPASQPGKATALHVYASRFAGQATTGLRSGQHDHRAGVHAPNAPCGSRRTGAFSLVLTQSPCELPLRLRRLFSCRAAMPPHRRQLGD